MRLDEAVPSQVRFVDASEMCEDVWRALQDSTP